MRSTSVLVNGEPAESISVFDRGLQFGDGLFETIAVVDGNACLLERHLQRLLRGCQHFRLNCPSMELLKAEIFGMSRDSERAVLKLLLTRGDSGRGYGYETDIIPNRILYRAEWPRDTVASPASMKLELCETRLGINPLTAQFKHTGRIEQVLARAELAVDPELEGLMLDVENHVVEGISSNLFLEFDGRLHTPLLDRAGVSGVVRGLIMDIAEARGAPVVERRVSLPELGEADAVFLCNSVLGVVPIRRFRKYRWDESKWTNGIIETAVTRTFTAKDGTC